MLRIFLIGFVPLLLISGCSKKEPSSMEGMASASSSNDNTTATGHVETKNGESTKPIRYTEKKPPYPAPPGMVWIPGGTFSMGGTDERTAPDELPVHTVELDGFYIDQFEVTNQDFAEFVEATGYKTTAERKPELRSLKPGSAAEGIPIEGKFAEPGSVCLNPKVKDIKGRLDPRKGAYNWWDYIPGANWKHPEGPESSIEDRMDHPVVHVSWLDVQEYCKWAGKKLPTEAQWEFAARGGLKKTAYPWGDLRNPDGKWMHNIWQGEFPFENTVEDGYRTTAPIGQFPPNGYDLYDMSGNAWEWVADYYRPDYYSKSPRRNPLGPATSLDPQEPDIIKRVQRGGSFMCSDSYCIAYRVAARMKGEQDTGAFHTGFRCVMTPEMVKDHWDSEK